MQTNGDQRPLSEEQLLRAQRNREAALKRRSLKHGPQAQQVVPGTPAGGEQDGEWRCPKARRYTSAVVEFMRKPSRHQVQGGGAEQVDEASTQPGSQSRNLPVTPYVPMLLQPQQVPLPAESRDEARPDDQSFGGQKLTHKLSTQQVQALQIIESGKSIFLTGSAGTGKSYMLAHAIRLLRIKYGQSAVFVTASTGLAACSIGGTTVHSFGGIGLGEASKEDLLERVYSRRETRMRWEAARGLVIDEISMIDGGLFDKLEFIARRIRGGNKPFGGIQLVVTGDFFQLPPVSKGSQPKRFAFEAESWDHCFGTQLELTHVFRQADSAFVGILNGLRRGRCSPADERRLTARRAALAGEPADGITLTRLYPHKHDVARENEQRLGELPEVEMMYTAHDEVRTEFHRNLLDNTNAVRMLVLKVGAQVILLKNLDTSVGLANGARGVVVGFCAPDLPEARRFLHLPPDVCPCGMWPVVRFAADGSERVMGPEIWAIHEGATKVAERVQVPLMLAWALSVHKCQGMTLDRVETNLAKAFDYGMVYVALSRVRSLEGLRLLGFDKSKMKIHPKVEEYYDSLASRHQVESH